MNFIILIDEIRSKADEGIYNFAVNLGKAENCFLLAESIKHTGISFNLIKNIRKYNPDIIVYIPTASLTIVSFLRAAFIKIITKKKTVIIGLQFRSYNKLIKKCLILFKPDFLFVQTKREFNFFKKMDFNVLIIPSGVDLEKFKVVNNARKIQLRKKYNIQEKDFVICHVGPLRKSRNLQVFKKLANIYKVFIVGSTSLPQDEEIKQNILSNGGIVIDNFLSNIEEIYQLSDIYIFPVQKEGAAISFPLTILEAMACNLPVISTHFGALPHFLKEEKGFFWADYSEEILDKVDKIKKIQKIQTRKIAEQFPWEKLTEKYIK